MLNCFFKLESVLVLSLDAVDLAETGSQELCPGFLHGQRGLHSLGSPIANSQGEEADEGAGSTGPSQLWILSYRPRKFTFVIGAVSPVHRVDKSTLCVKPVKHWIC